MSVTKNAHLNGHPAKRRKLSHESVTTNNSSLASQESATEVVEGEDDATDSSDDTADDTATVSVPEGTSQTPKTDGNARPRSVTVSTGSSSATLVLQAQSLIAEAKPDYASRIRNMRPTTDKIIQVIKATPDQQPMSFSQAQSFSQKTLQLNIPWSTTPASDIKYKFSYSRPAKIAIHGSIMRHIGPREMLKMTIVPEMPAELFQGKDYLNYRAIHKRAFYLACIASNLKKDMVEDFEVEFSLADGNELVPIIRLSSKTSDRRLRDVELEISPALPPSVGPLDKITPAHNCVRKEELSSGSIASAAEDPAFYNSTIRSLASIDSSKQLLEHATSKADHYQDACLLGAVWLRQRGFSSNQDGGGFGLSEWAAACALLLQSGGHQNRALFSPRYSAIQLFKAMLQVLSGRDLYDPLILRGTIVLSRSKQPVMYDANTGVNVLYKMTPWSYERLKHYATISLATVNSKKIRAFESSFITKISDTALQYDESYQVTLPRSSAAKMDHLYNVLKTGLSDRVSLIDLQHPRNLTWNITSLMPVTEAGSVTIGLLVNAEAATRLVDHGPPVEEKQESKQFQEFWGSKAELRRFKDGSISESLVWSDDAPVTQQIIQYLLSKHFKLSPGKVKSCAVLEKTQLPSSLSAHEAFQAINTTFQSLSLTLHHLDNLPLPVRSVSAASQGLRSSALILPLEPGTAHPVDVFIQFDSSGRWPDDLRAIQYTKIAFLNQVADKLAQHNRELETRIGVENTSTSSRGAQNTSYLDVVYPSPSPAIPPIIFRLRIYHERELQLLQQTLSAKSTLSPPLREIYQSALHSQKQTASAIAHTTAFRTLITAFPPLSATIRLLKRFIASHHLSLHLPSEVLEIMAANVFLSPAPWSTPGTATTAFARCLHLLARWDWAAEPLIVDLSLAQDMTIEQRRELETRFAAWRKMDPNMNTVSWFVGTNIDTSGVVWMQGIAGSDPRPPRVIAGRLTALAGAALSVIKCKSNAESKIMTKSDWDGVFLSSLEDFDFVLHLKRNKSGKSKGGQFKNLEIAAGLDVDTTGMDDVALYVADLQRAFGSVAVFFYGGKDCGSNVIGGLWRPHVRRDEARPWRIRLGYSTIPVPMSNDTEADSDDDQERKKALCRVNIDGMLAEIGTMGERMVERITTKA